MIGQHKLVLLNFYSFVQRYLAAHQQNVTDIFSFLIQACHEHVPPAEVLPIVKLIADNFINERCSPEAVQVGINAFREVVLRCPSVLHEEDLSPLLQDLVQYRKSHEKEVKTAARSLLNLIRELHPGALKRKDRGKDHSTWRGSHRLPSPCMYLHTTASCKLPALTNQIVFSYWLIVQLAPLRPMSMVHPEQPMACWALPCSIVKKATAKMSGRWRLMIVAAMTATTG